jgi:predicted PhzF superfamily epimerase YddE/YHI9
VDQGVEMLRPSRLYLEIGESNRVGGRVQAVATGEFD